MPTAPKIYHILHVNRLPSILADGYLWCDAEVRRLNSPGTNIGMKNIKSYRLKRALGSYPNMNVGDCVPFNFCPRSVMLYVIHQANHAALTYRGGQGPIIHLEADFRRTAAWAKREGLRWVFTNANAATAYFDDFADPSKLSAVNWHAVQADQWSGGTVHASIKEGKQAEFLVEQEFPWELVERIAVVSRQTYNAARLALRASHHRPPVVIRPDWYY